MKKITKKKSKYFSINKKEFFIVGPIGAIIISFIESYFFGQFIEMLKNDPSRLANANIFYLTLWVAPIILLFNLGVICIVMFCVSDNKNS